MISAILAFCKTDTGYLVGSGSKIPWKCKPDMSWFVKNTIGKTVLFGASTFEGMLSDWPDHVPFMQNRKVVVATSRAAEMSAKHSNLLNVTFVEDAVDFLLTVPNSSECVVAGGPIIYESCYQLIERLYLTEIILDHDPKLVNDPKFLLKNTSAMVSDAIESDDWLPTIVSDTDDNTIACMSTMSIT